MGNTVRRVLALDIQSADTGGLNAKTRYQSGKTPQRVVVDTLFRGRGQVFDGSWSRFRLNVPR